ncbi:MAG TPA: KH domain-containing protein [Chloroflexus aurantiacus]|uniref:RNA-binding protein KhpB n=1 Tax=Chloroflexus aurantiacus (strain ATCC 29366 / DSM 635 / J-10-fl) TaxID=324602 RepID=A9WBG9_CHLAA|nr:RNA-binding cell elongation regulator Jag/EloR [Chloroflexus aurantiacus]ABY33376.1 single-stranded nucleic acid binding R3H domain protein [Chloroflexus aurantiacus J-10-fl]HBW66730.1 KH domain-containing protein [Chloroflexus aurantiacus]
MKRIEISERTVAEAVELALAQLGRDRDEVAIEVLDPGENGDEALVRVTVVEDEEEAPSVEKVSEIAQRVLEDLLERMDIHAYVTAVISHATGPNGEPEATITLHVEGADEEAMGLLIGRRGETLRSLQFLLNLLVSRRVQKWPQLVVDVGNYRQRRQESLESLARRMAERVRQTGRPIMLEPMAAYERRIVHLALRNDKTIYTESSGEGENRKIVIYPAKHS